MKRTEAEIKAYVDGYNDCFMRFKECLKGRKSVIDSIRKMELFVVAVNSCVESEPQTERPCNSCQEWDCYGCDYKQTKREDE